MSWAVHALPTSQQHATTYERYHREGGQPQGRQGVLLHHGGFHNGDTGACQVSLETTNYYYYYYYHYHYYYYYYYYYYRHFYYHHWRDHIN